jgi:hypothetical protein
MYYLIHAYFALNIFFVGRYWEEFYIFKPDFPEKFRLFILIVVGFFVAFPFVFSLKMLDYLSKPTLYFRKTHIQIGSTCFVWGGGLSSRKGEFIELSKFETDKRFVVKKYKYISIINDAVS